MEGLSPASSSSLAPYLRPSGIVSNLKIRCPCTQFGVPRGAYSTFMRDRVLPLDFCHEALQKGFK